jgi:hypothetical protein
VITYSAHSSPVSSKCGGSSRIVMRTAAKFPNENRGLFDGIDLLSNCNVIHDQVSQSAARILQTGSLKPCQVSEN